MYKRRFREVNYRQEPVKRPLHEPVRMPNYDDRLPRKKPVTIAAGFRFDRGLLLCADTQYTADQKTYESKMFHIQHGAAHVVLILVGYEDYARRAIEMISEKVKNVPLDALTKENLHNAIESGIQRMLVGHVYHRPDLGKETCPDFQFVIGVYSPIDGAFLMKTAGEVAIIVDDKVCLGSGGYLGDYLSKMYLGSKQSLNEVTAFATYFLREIKAHDLSCGGKSEVIVLWDTGGISPRRTQDIALAEDYATSFNEASTAMFYALADLEKSNEQIDEEMRKAYESLYHSLTSRREMREQEKLVQDLQQKFSNLEKPSGE
jgi:hypothetical protein